MELSKEEQKIKEREERTFKIKHDDACFIVFKNGDIISISPEMLYNAIEEHIKNLIAKNVDQKVLNKILSDRDKLS